MSEERSNISVTQAEREVLLALVERELEATKPLQELANKLRVRPTGSPTRSEVPESRRP